MECRITLLLLWLIGVLIVGGSVLLPTKTLIGIVPPALPSLIIQILTFDDVY